jgi:hypothetical protein
MTNNVSIQQGIAHLYPLIIHNWKAYWKDTFSECSCQQTSSVHIRMTCINGFKKGNSILQVILKGHEITFPIIYIM